MNTILDYEAWAETYEEELYILAAESGADREYDFDEDRFYEKQYEEYLKAECHHCDFYQTKVCYDCPAHESIVNTNKDIKDGIYPDPLDDIPF